MISVTFFKAFYFAFKVVNIFISMTQGCWIEVIDTIHAKPVFLPFTTFLHKQSGCAIAPKSQYLYLLQKGLRIYTLPPPPSCTVWLIKDWLVRRCRIMPLPLVRAALSRIYTVCRDPAWDSANVLQGTLLDVLLLLDFLPFAALFFYFPTRFSGNMSQADVCVIETHTFPLPSPMFFWSTYCTDLSY